MERDYSPLVCYQLQMMVAVLGKSTRCTPLKKATFQTLTRRRATPMKLANPVTNNQIDAGIGT
jgi:hypothetical protein